MAVITSPRNRQVAAAARLKKRGLREQDRRFLVEGAQAVGEALEAGTVEALFLVPGGRTAEVLPRARTAGVQAVEVSERVMAHLTSTVTPQGIVAVARFVDGPLEQLPADLRLVPVLCSVRDPGNAGTILRSADAAGASAVVFSSASVDPYNSKTVRASAGSLFHLPVVRHVSPEDAVATLRGRGLAVLAAAADGDRSLYEEDLSKPTAVLFGNEAWGFEGGVRGLADATIRVPIEGGAESLNLAAAAALVMFEALRQRTAAGDGGDLAALISASAHDLRLPLTAVKGFASTLADRWEVFDDGERRAMVEGMSLDTERAAAMIAMIVDVARLEGGCFRPSRDQVDLAPIAGWAAELFDRGPDHPRIEVSGSGRATIEPERLRAILLALCDGAIWWGREGPIEIEIRPRGAGATVEVRRRGAGPSPEEVDAMFGPPGGDGGKMGLHVARRVALAHGGTLTCTGGDGVRFLLTLPG